MIKAVIFDMDGVIIDSEPYYQKVLLEHLHHFQVPATIEDLIPLAGGTTQHYNQVLNPLIKDYVSRQDFDDYNSRFYRDNGVPYDQLLFPHVENLLSWIQNHGYRLAIASSSRQDEIQGVLDKCHLQNYFELLMSGDMFKESKPNPEIYITCVKKLGLKPEECIAVEDSEYGITAAKAAGLTCIARKDSRFGYDQSQADYFVEDLLDIIQILGDF